MRKTGFRGFKYKWCVASTYLSYVLYIMLICSFAFRTHPHTARFRGSGGFAARPRSRRHLSLSQSNAEVKAQLRQC